ncbi:23S rRNA (adenine(2503)-C(2))-methyltransferase RlmN [Salisediminibacterium selenitireducens]|uniref:Probable dual-specificity RNA methyltransferase RlmN n=1 Tax=Bacillus selenitireducens (strain ATCC 700615 / DSM 15326 / MLS10) TaxID=439292 RepID=D6XUL4_BACIE|nr:23S rRNA (adenine(2503)-C(2))-methyltransferase RlmN [Salisediminibacterium selenitireducens]ADH99500.1 radical SAM enzyme, Cfr family [[Bacillus] selenitireducens MLS10]
MNKTSIYGLTFNELEDWFEGKGEKKFRAKQVWDWLYVKRIRDFDDMTNIKKDTISLIKDHFYLESLELHSKQESKDGTKKFLFKLSDGNLIETVLMKFDYGNSVCVTTQVGCNIGCSFCASGLLKKDRDLTSAEIVEQILKVQFDMDDKQTEERVSHIVVMGIGEPFDNYDNLMSFLRIVNSDRGLAIGARHITVSTSGLVEKIRAFADENLQVNLAVSLHAPNNDLRSSIMKINKGQPIEDVMSAIDYYLEKTNRRITLEYILLDGVNDKPEHAKELAELVRDKKKLTYINLIPYNPVDEYIQYKQSEKGAILTFYDLLMKNGVQCGVRHEQGSDIDAACGQLRSKQMKKDREKAKS